MLKKITVSGYKSLHESQAVFAPLTVIIGRNNVGKSNLFDALRLLSHLAQMPVASAFKPEKHRGDPIESFWAGQILGLTLQAEFDLAGHPHPGLTGQLLTHTELQYNLRLGFEHGTFEIHAETLRGRGPTQKNWQSFIAHETGSHLTVLPELPGKPRQFGLPLARSLLTQIDDAEYYPHLVAFAHALSTWRFFHFEPEALREPSPVIDILELEATGRGLSGFYATLQSREPKRFQLVKRALQRAIPEAQDIRVLDTGDHRRLLAVVHPDGREFTARVLSDGTLRFLALLALAYAPHPPGLVCFEEPENGVHPSRLYFIVDILRGLSARGSEGGSRPQVLVNSHSPYLVDLLETSEVLCATLTPTGETRFAGVAQDLLDPRPVLKQLLEDGEQTLGELWAQGGLDANA